MRMTLPSPSSLQAVSSIWTSTPPPRGPLLFMRLASVSRFVFGSCLVWLFCSVGGGPPPPIPLLLGLLDRRNKYLETGKSPRRPNTFVTPTENFRDFDFSHNTNCNVTLLLLYLIHEAHTITTGFFVVFNGFIVKTSECK